MDQDKNGAKARPFVKWAGGKSQLLPELLKRVPQTFGRYYEPFLGGGALFFALQSHPEFPEFVILNDICNELINAYDQVSFSVEELIEDLSLYKYDSDQYYDIRAWDRETWFLDLERSTRAARFLYINRCGYNGLWRVNSKGQCNVPFGAYTNPTICDAENLRACAKALSGAWILNQDYSLFPDLAPLNFVYVDPPYEPVSETSNFVGYAKGGFTTDDQVKLCEWLKKLDKQNIRWMLSNSVAPVIQELYRDFNVEFVSARRNVNSDPDKRVKVQEVIIRNYEGETDKWTSN